MTDDILRTDRADLLARIAELETALTTARSDNEMLRAHNASLVSGASYAAMAENLEVAQTKGSALQDEARALRRVLAHRIDARTVYPTIFTDNGPTPVVTDSQFQVLIDLLKVRWQGDAKYGTAEAHADRPLAFGHESADWAKECLAALRLRKGPGGYESFVDIIAEEFLELILETDESRIESEAIDVANVCLKMVEAIRIRRARGAK